MMTRTAKCSCIRNYMIYLLMHKIIQQQFYEYLGLFKNGLEKVLKIKQMNKLCDVINI